MLTANCVKKNIINVTSAGKNESKRLYARTERKTKRRVGDTQ